MVFVDEQIIDEAAMRIGEDSDSFEEALNNFQTEQPIFFRFPFFRKL